MSIQPIRPRAAASRSARLLGTTLALALCSIVAAQPPATVVVSDPPQWGPYNGTFLPDGPGLRVPISDPRDPILLADSVWSLSCWIKATDPLDAFSLVAGVGSPAAEYPRYLAVDAGKVALWMGEDNQLTAPANLKPGEWHLLAASFDGSHFHLYADGQPAASGTLILGSPTALLQMAPSGVGTPGHHFGGQIAALTLLRRALSDDEMHQLYLARPNFSTIVFEEGSKPWPIQTRGQAGYRAPQDPATMPTCRAPFSAPVAIQRPPVGPSLTSTEPGRVDLLRWLDPARGSQGQC